MHQELLKLYPPLEAEEKLKLTGNDFPGRLRQYQKLSGRKLSDTFDTDLKRTRALRHSIVHRGKRITFCERGNAQRVRYYLLSYMRRVEHQQYNPTFDDIVLNIMPLLKNGITPEKQTILNVLQQIAVRTDDGHWKLADRPQLNLL